MALHLQALFKLLQTHVKVNVSPAMSHGGQRDHSSSPCLLHPLQQQIGQQEVTQVVHPELDAISVLSPPVCHQSWGHIGTMVSEIFVLP